MRRKGAYRGIAVMLPIFLNHFRKDIQIAGYPIFICHEITYRDVQKADKEEVQISKLKYQSRESSNSRRMRRFGYISLREEKWQRLFTWVHMKSVDSLMNSCSRVFQKKENYRPYSGGLFNNLWRFCLKRY
jgi:hypothetical protein